MTSTAGTGGAVAPSLPHPLQALLSGMAAPPAAAEAAGSLPPMNYPNLLLCGPADSCRSSLALHFALAHAECTLQPVLLLCRRDGLEQPVPLLPHHLAGGTDLLTDLLHIKYIRNDLDLQRWSACAHLLATCYSAIVVEDVSSMMRSDDRNALVRTLAMLVEGVEAYRSCASVDADVDADEAEPSLRPAATPQAPSAAAAAAALATTATPKAPDAVTAVRRCCRLLVTESSEDKRRPRYIYERWFPPQATFVVTPSPGDAGGSGRYCLGVGHGGAGWAAQAGEAAQAGAMPPPPPAAAAGGRCVYRCHESHLQLEEVHV